MRPVAAWLALSRDTIFDDDIVAPLDPAVVLDHGDPQSLSAGATHQGAKKSI